MSRLSSLLAASEPPAGGAALDEVVQATAGVGVVTVLLLVVAWMHRTHRTDRLQRLADAVGRRTGRPGWVALPSLLTALSLITALFGMLWDIALHIGRGRDEGPLANPAHYFILVGLFMVFAAGMLAVVLPRDGEKPGPASVRITRTWHAPVGGLLVAASGFYALTGFPLDDVWHRLFGQDVTLWGPTHLMLITGAGLSLIGMLVLEQEGHASGQGSAAPARVAWFLRVSALGGMLIGLSVFQAEFDFGVPQFRLVLHPMMIAGAAGFALVAARLIGGRGAAVGAAVFFLVLRGGIALIVGPGLGEPTPSLPLYLGSAVLVELLALTPLLRSPLAFGAVGGLLIGTVGSAVEAGWSYVAMPLPWTPDVWVEGLLMTVPVAVGAGLCGALLALGVQGRLPRPSVSRPVLVGSLLVLAAATANGLVATVPEGRTAQIDVTAAGEGTVDAVVRFDEELADDPAWVQITAWQGGQDGLVVDRLERTGPGEYRSTTPLPVDGTWKTLLRVHDGRSLSAVPVFLPEDAAIEAEEVPVEDATREFVPEITLLQRERDLAAPTWLWTVSSLVVLALSVALVAALAWGVGRLSRRITPAAFEEDSPYAAQEQGLDRAPAGQA